MNPMFGIRPMNTAISGAMAPQGTPMPAAMPAANPQYAQIAQAMGARAPGPFGAPAARPSMSMGQPPMGQRPMQRY